MQKEYKNPPIMGIVRREDGRYLIIDTVTSDVLHDGQFGYMSYTKTYNYVNNQYHTKPVNLVVGIPAKSEVVEDPLSNS